MSTTKPGTLEDRVKEFKKLVAEAEFGSAPHVIGQAQVLIDDLWAALRIYREIEKENRGKQI